MDRYDFDIPPNLAVELDRRRRRAESGIITKLVLGAPAVGIGVYTGNVLYTKWVIHEAGKALRQFDAAMKAEMQASAEAARLVQAGIQARAERARQQQLAIERERTRQKQMELDYRQAQADWHLAAVEEGQRKEVAWNQHYRRPAMCENATREDAIIECGNHYVRERKKSEALWAAKRASSDRLIVH